MQPVRAEGRDPSRLSSCRMSATGQARRQRRQDPLRRHRTTQAKGERPARSGPESLPPRRRQENRHFPETVRGIRNSLADEKPDNPDTPPSRVPPDPQSSLQKLRSDPAVRSKEVGRDLIQSLSQLAKLVQNHNLIMENIPEYAISSIANAARKIADQADAIAGQVARNPNE